MNNCFERAMFAASESYSHNAYDLEDGGCAERFGEKENPVLRVEEPVAVMRAA